MRQAQGINAEKPLASLTTSREATSFGLFSLLDRLEAYRTTASLSNAGSRVGQIRLGMPTHHRVKIGLQFGWLRDGGGDLVWTSVAKNFQAAD